MRRFVVGSVIFSLLLYPALLVKLVGVFGVRVKLTSKGEEVGKGLLEFGSYEEVTKLLIELDRRGK